MSQASLRIEEKIESSMEKMEALYWYCRVLRSELDLENGQYTTHTSANSLIHELDN